MAYTRFQMKPYHRCGVDKFGKWISSGKCEFNDDRATRIEVWRYRDDQWQPKMEEPQNDNYELLQLMFAAEQRRLEKRIANTRNNNPNRNQNRNGNRNKR